MKLKVGRAIVTGRQKMVNIESNLTAGRRLKIVLQFLRKI